MLSFPLAMASAGLIPGVITCVFSGSVAILGLYLLSRCATRASHRHSSFFAIANLTYPRLAVFFDAAIAIKCFGVSISYLIIIKGLMPSVVKSLYHVLSPNDPPEWTLSGRIWITLFMVVLIPLCFLRRLDSLRHTSYVALFSVAYLLAVVIVCYAWPPKGITPPGEIHLIHFTPSFISTFPVQVFAFTCAQNLFPIYNELRTNSQERMNIVMGSSIGSAVLTYEVIAVLGYLTFGSKVGANIIAMYPSTSLFIAGGQAAIVVLVLFSYPLQVHPCRNCLDKVFSSVRPSPQAAIKPAPTAVIPADGEVPVSTSLIAEEEEEEEEPVISVEDHAALEMSERKHVALTTAIIVLGFAVAYMVDDLQLVLSFVGSTGSTTLSFILPGIFYYKLFAGDTSEAKWLRPASLVLAIYGICIFIFCLSFNIYQVIGRGSTQPV